MIQPYSREFFAPRPSPLTLFFRTFLPWQLLRFVWINVKMIQMIGKAHSHRALPPAGGAAGASKGTRHGTPAASAAG